MSPLLHRLGRFSARRPWTVIGSWLLVSALVIVASGAFGRELEDSFDAPGVDSAKATALLTKAGSDQAGLTAQMVVTPRDGTLPSAALEDLRARAADLPHVVGVGEPEISPDGRVALLTLQYPPLAQVRPGDLEALKAVGDGTSSLRVEMGGDLFFALEEPEAGAGELVGLAVAALILLVAFGSVIAAGLPVGIAVVGLVLGISSMSLVTYLVDIPVWAPEFAAMIGLGVGIDYALFLLTRYRECLADGLPVEEAVGRAVATAGRAVVFAGGTVVIAILGLAVAGIPFITAAGVAIAVLVLIMVLAAITLLPALLRLAGRRIGRRRAAVGAGWLRWGRHVTRRRWPYLIAGTALLLAMAAPVLDLRIGNPDAGVLPESRTERRAYDLAATGFGAGVNGPLVVVGSGQAREAVAADEGIASVGPLQTLGGVSTFTAIPTTGPQDDATVRTIERLRADVPGVHIGGQTAVFADVSGRVGDRLPWFVAAVILLSFVLLAVVFRSILVPLKAALLNLLSIGASYGVLVMVFQWGWGADLIGLESTIPIVSFIPLFMFAILFGLSMDYEVFLLSRVREEHLAGADPDTAVVRGIAGTARVITSAALIMISVFLAFVAGSDPTIKLFGLGLATAILIDATIVRLVLVPAAMSILGDAAWWLPWTNGRLGRRTAKATVARL